VAADVAAVLDHLGIDEYVTAGWSGGGPHALACAALHPDRCRAAATLAGVAPQGVPGLDFLDGMGPENVAEFGAALQGEQVLRSWMEENVEAFRRVTGTDLIEAFGGLVPDIDKEVLRGGYANHMAAEIRRALASGFDGWVDDDLAFVRPWGFELSAISVPVTVWQGDLDLMVPASHGAWLVESLPAARPRTPAGHGHISLVTQHRAEILDWLLMGWSSTPA
jgi:pimeloyl-ACP methyl ester carboxylesterase